MLTEQQQIARRELLRRTRDDEYMNQLLGDEAFCLAEIAAKKGQVILEAQQNIDAMSEQINVLSALRDKAEASKAVWEGL